VSSVAGVCNRHACTGEAAAFAARTLSFMEVSPDDVLPRVGRPARRGGRRVPSGGGASGRLHLSLGSTPTGSVSGSMSGSTRSQRASAERPHHPPACLGILSRQRKCRGGRPRLQALSRGSMSPFRTSRSQTGPYPRPDFDSPAREVADVDDAKADWSWRSHVSRMLRGTGGRRPSPPHGRARTPSPHIPEEGGADRLTLPVREQDATRCAAHVAAGKGPEGTASGYQGRP
jgi:hypothetical protein